MKDKNLQTLIAYAIAVTILLAIIIFMMYKSEMENERTEEIRGLMSYTVVFAGESAVLHKMVKTSGSTLFHVKGKTDQQVMDVNDLIMQKAIDTPSWINLGELGHATNSGVMPNDIQMRMKGPGVMPNIIETGVEVFSADNLRCLVRSSCK